MKTDRKGILAAGNWIVDKVKITDTYPEQETLANILSESVSNGGSPYNILKDLSKLGVHFPLEAIGLIGDDEAGEYILNDCKASGIITSQLNKTGKLATSYTDVITSQVDGKRTFFHYRGANSFLNISDFNLETSNAKIFHLGYLLLLDKMDELNSEGTTAAAQVLKKAQNMGFRTSIDIVSENTNRFKSVITPSLPFVDYLFINEFEAEKLTGVSTSSSDKNISIQGCIEAAKYIFTKGVKQWVVLHFPSGAIAVDHHGATVYQGSVNMPQQKIKGTVGAGDAFAAGVLMGLHEHKDMKECLIGGVCAAASCLLEADCSSGILPINECIQLGSMHGFRALNE